MNDLALMAATEWARTNAGTSAGANPAEFGHKVALVYVSCCETELNGSAVAPVGDSVAAKLEALYQAAKASQAAHVYRDATGRILSLEETKEFLRNRASQATDPGPSEKRTEPDSEMQTGRTEIELPAGLDGSPAAPLLRASAHKTELRG